VISPTAIPWSDDAPLVEQLAERGVSRREFLGFCTQMAVVLGLGSIGAPRIARALESLKRPSVVWLSLQECTGCTESVLRSGDPTIGSLVLDLVSLDFQENLMAAAGSAAESALASAMKENHGKYVLVVTGSIPLNENGIYTCIAGRTAKEILLEAAEGAAAIIAVGACAHWGNIQASKPNPTGAVGVSDVVKGKDVVNIAGCPPIAEVVTGTIVNFLTFGKLPATDSDGRPLFAYGTRIHDSCSRRAHYDAGQFVERFDDEAAKKGWCLYKVGCKGPAAFSPCPVFMWNEHTSWPIGAGHPCLGCTERKFWDTMTPFYGRLPNVPGVGVEHTADLLGAALAVGALGGVLAHAAATGVNRLRARELPVINNPPPPPPPSSPTPTPKA